MYKRRNEVERLFRRLKEFRRIFSRFEKLDVIFPGFIVSALIFDALRQCEHAPVHAEGGGFTSLKHWSSVTWSGRHGFTNGGVFSGDPPDGYRPPAAGAGGGVLADRAVATARPDAMTMVHSVRHIP